MKHKYLKILGWTLAVVCGLFLIVLLTADFWAPSVIRPLLKEQGVTFGEITREEGHYSLTDVEYINDAMTAEIGELQIPTLWRLASKRWFGSESEAIVFVNAGELTLIPDSTPSEPDPEDSGPIDMPSLLSDGLDYWEMAFEWVDFVETNNFELLFEPGGKPMQLDLELNASNLQLWINEIPQIESLNENIGDIDLEISREGNRSLNLSILSEKLALQMQSEIEVSSEINIDGQVTYQGEANRIAYSATLGPEGYIPTEAHAETTDFILPAELAELPDYEQPSITLRADWDGAKADIDLNATAAPKEKDLPPLKVALKARGDDQIVNVEQFNAEAWSSKIALSKPLRVDINNLKDLPDAELTVDLNLSDIPDQRLDGRLQGALIVDHQPGEGWPLLTADFAGNDLRYEDFSLNDFLLRAQVDYPAFKVDALEASIGEGTRVKVTAQGDAERRELGSAQLELTAGASLLETLEPIIGEQDFAFDSLSVTATASGPLETPRHAGELRIDGLQMKEGIAMNVASEWDADWLEFSKLNLSAKNERSGVELSAQASLGGETREVTINTMQLDVREQPELMLEAPFTLTLAGSAVSLTPMRLVSEAGGELRLRAQVDYPQSGKLELMARDVSAVWLELVLTEPLDYTVKLDELDVSAAWDQGPLQAKLFLDAGLIPQDQPEVELMADITLEDGKVSLPAMRVVQGNFTLLNARGELPMVVTPAGERLWSLAKDAPIDFELTAEPDDSPLWNFLENLISLDFIRPGVVVRLDGDVNAPEGKIDLRFDALQVLSSTEDARELPRLENGEFKVTLDPSQIALTQGGLSISGQPLTMQAKAPMSEEAWIALFQGTPPDWKTATAQMDFTDVPLSAFKDWLPDVLREDGDLTLRASLKSGGKVEGSLDIDNVQTRPLAAVGSVNDINAAFRLEDRTLRVEQAEARVGGAPLNVTGRVDLNDQWQPVFDLALKGESVPLARAPGLILRGSPDITLKTDGEGVTTVGGVLKLEESFFTMDLGVFRDDGGGGGAARGGKANAPPFFSIGDKPLADWRLHLTLEGDRFLRARVPTFVGVVSAGFELRGTLRNPIMYGAAEPQQGVVMFPFATLKLDDGAISISQNDPTVIRLDIVGSGRAYGYDLVMRITGTANDPIVTFTSTPSLEQSDIILMITSGQIPQHARSTESRLSGIGMYIGKSFLVDLGLIDPLDDTLQVIVGEDVTTQGKDTVKVIYRINDDWSLEGAYDKYDAYYLDARYRIWEE